MNLLLLAPAAFAGGGSADIVAERVIKATPEQLYEQVIDLRNMQSLFQGACIGTWRHGSINRGIGAQAMVTYRAGAMNRELLASVVRDEPGWLVDVDHPGRKGFKTRWLFEQVEAGTQVTLTTYLSEPMWPFQGYFYKHVHPDWTACYEYALVQLEKAAK